MQRPASNAVVTFPNRRRSNEIENETEIETRRAHDTDEHDDPDAAVADPEAILAAAIGDQRAQIRLPLKSLVQAEKDLVLLQDAIAKALTQVRSGRKRGDPSALCAVRELVSGANKLINAKTQQRTKAVKSAA